MAQSVNLPLKEVERIEITTLIDSYVDLMLQDPDKEYWDKLKNYY